MRWHTDATPSRSCRATPWSLRFPLGARMRGSRPGWSRMARVFRVRWRLPIGPAAKPSTISAGSRRPRQPRGSVRGGCDRPGPSAIVSPRVRLMSGHRPARRSAAAGLPRAAAGSLPSILLRRRLFHLRSTKVCPSPGARDDCSNVGRALSGTGGAAARSLASTSRARRAQPELRLALEQPPRTLTPGLVAFVPQPGTLGSRSSGAARRSAIRRAPQPRPHRFAAGHVLQASASLADLQPVARDA